MTAQIERALQHEIMLRLKAWPVLALPIPNSIYFPARTPAERDIIARVISQMKRAGQLVPGAPDIAVFWRGGGGLIEVKRPALRDLLGKRSAGQPSDEQRDIADRAASLGINHAYCRSWEEVRDRLCAWGVAGHPRTAPRELDELLDAREGGG